MADRWRQSVNQGSRACYQTRCGHPDCAAVNRAYAAEHARRRRRLLADPDDMWMPFVPAGPARQHLMVLRDQGVGLWAVSRATGVSYKALYCLVVGDPARGGRRTRRLKIGTARAILTLSAVAIRPKVEAVNIFSAVSA